MSVPAEVARRYHFEAPYVERVGSLVRDILFAFCGKHGFAYLGRQKELPSLWEKLEGGRFANWDEIDDLFACAVIIPQVADEAIVLQYLSRTFTEVGIRKRGTTLKEPSVFRFDATRFYGKLTSLQAPDPKSRVGQIVFEVQIRTAFEHAWSVTTHALSYKGDTVDWKLLRLAAQLKASVEQLDALVSGYERSAAEMSAHPWPETTAKQMVESFFKNAIDAEILSTECAPKSWVRFCDSFLAVIVSAQGTFISPKQVVPLAKGALKLIEQEFLKPAFVAPRSLSLMQLSLGILTTSGFLTGPVRNYTPPSFSEIKSLYPAIVVLGAGFEC